MDKEFEQTRINDVQFIEIPVIQDRRGNLAFIQEPETGFTFERVFYVYDIPAGAQRGGHAHIEQREMLIAISGSFDVIVFDGKEYQRFTLNRPDVGLIIPYGIWRELENFSTNSIYLTLNTGLYDERDYIRNFDRYLKMKLNGSSGRTPGL